MSKYKVGDKFIVEVAEIFEEAEEDLFPDELYRIRGFNSLVFDDDGLDELQKYTETQIPYSEAYNQGLQDAWELVRKLYLDGKQKYSPEEQKEIFGGSGITYVIEHYTPQEALAKIEAYEKEKAKIKVGDVVRAHENHEYVVIATSEEMPNNQPLLRSLENTKNVCFCTNDRMKKTGKHIDIQSILDGIGKE